MARSVVSRGLIALLALLAAACSTIPASDAERQERGYRYEDRLAILEIRPSWSLEGRLAVSDENDGGSGHFNWRQDSQGGSMDFHGALGRGAWNLVSNPAGAVLEMADGSRYQADSVDLLARQRLGWQIPVDYLAWWVRGLAAPEEIEERRLDENGNLTELRQRGWLIEYGKYRDIGGILMPVKMSAKKSDKTVKLAIRTWILPHDREDDG